MIANQFDLVANQLYSTAGHVGCTILRSKPQEAHMLQQRQTSGKVVGKYHYHHPKAARMYGGMLSHCNNVAEHAITLSLQALLSES